MSESVRAFFDDLTRSGGRMLRQVSGRIRFDLVNPRGVDHWLVTIDRGRITVSQGGPVEADTVINTDETLFLRMAYGEVKPLPAWLRNDFTADGEFRFVVMLERLFAPPKGARHPRVVATRAAPADDRKP
ncbi:SCP2 sterol-binding domain-containing protein [Micromonospora sp. NPDC048871]|uniref:SCP2 sterol-binding domain-containing protein n=1 Tax=Micromonospora sp. NPDC048871 TaxID=3364259 RepID=UPI003719F61B